MKWVCRVYVYRHWLDWFEKSSIEKFDFKYFKCLILWSNVRRNDLAAHFLPKSVKKIWILGKFWKPHSYWIMHDSTMRQLGCHAAAIYGSRGALRLQWRSRGYDFHRTKVVILRSNLANATSGNIVSRKLAELTWLHWDPMVGRRL